MTGNDGAYLYGYREGLLYKNLLPDMCDSYNAGYEDGQSDWEWSLKQPDYVFNRLLIQALNLIEEYKKTLL